MSLHPFSHPWEVQHVEDGTSVKLSHRDLDVQTLLILPDELFELAQVSGRPRLYLDFGKVNLMTSVALGKLIVLDRRLREAGRRLVLRNLSPALQEVFQAVNWPSDSTSE
jgi:anti-sigma B factor antagonist